MRALIAALALAAVTVPSAGCLRSTTFTCGGDPDCSGGTCETNGFCAFADATCASGRRYGDLSGPVANQCVGDEDPEVDGPPGTPDAPPPIDSEQSLCPGTYMTVPNAPNVYRLLAGPGSWTDQQVICTADTGGYLIIPGTQTELDAITAFAASEIWVGISDRGDEGIYLDVRGGTQTFLPWAGGQPDNDPPGEDCVLATGSLISDERCGLNHPAVCECEP
jgi:hypothetical protein